MVEDMESRENWSLIVNVLKHRLIPHEQHDPIILPDRRVFDNHADPEVLEAAGQSGREIISGELSVRRL